MRAVPQDTRGPLGNPQQLELFLNLMVKVARQSSGPTTQPQQLVGIR